MISVIFFSVSLLKRVYSKRKHDIHHSQSDKEVKATAEECVNAKGPEFVNHRNAVGPNESCCLEYGPHTGNRIWIGRTIRR